MDLCPGGNILDRLSGRGHFSEKDAAEIFKNVMSVVSVLSVRIHASRL